MSVSTIGPVAHPSFRERLEERTFPLTPRNLALAFGLWVLVAMSLPTSAMALIGPYRVVSVAFDSLGWSDAFEWTATVLISLLIGAVTLALAVALTHIVVVTEHRHVRYGVPAALAVAAFLTAALIVNPSYMIGGLDQQTTTYRNFAFGSFPSEDRVEELGREGYTIVSLVHPSVLPFEARLLEIERRWAEDKGTPLISIPMMPWMSQNEEAVANLQQLALDGDGKYYVHCWFGFHRTMDARTVIIETIEPGSSEAAPPEDYGPRHLQIALPDIRLLVLLGPVVALFALTLGGIVAYLRSERRMQPSGTRKVVHIAIFSAAAVIQLAFGFPGVILFGTVMAIALGYASWRGRGFAFYDGVARNSEGPRRRGLVLLPFAATGVGGIAVNLLFYPFAAVGYLVNGFGDAAGEIIGKRFGRHRYTLHLPFGMTPHRSLEGTLGVALVATAAAFVGLVLVSRVVLDPTAGGLLLAALAIGTIAAVVEAGSGGGIDNFTIQLSAAATAYLMVG